MSRKNRPRVAAFTLIEVMFAGAVLIAGAAAMLTAYYTLMGVAEHQRRFSTASQVTRGKLEEVLAAWDLTAIPRASIVNHLGMPTGLAPTSALTPETYLVSWTSTEDLPAVGYQTITVTTRWDESRGASRTTDLATVRRR